MSNYLYSLVGVLGSPVSENPAVPMMEAAFRERNLRWKYLAIEVRSEELSEAIHGLRGFYNIRGVNVTMPYKTEVIEFLDELASDAKIMGAVNLIRKDNQKLVGENTDGKGFMKSLMEDAGVNPKGKHVILLGAGGAARAIGVELALAGSERITIVNRTEKRGEELSSLICSNTSCETQYAKWDSTYSIPQESDILINATSIGFSPNIDSRPDINYDRIREGMVVCDVVPYPPRTHFLQEAERRGAITLDGLGMLVYQGAIGFNIWTGLDAPVQAMKEALRNEFR